ncbi:MAG: 16S rRNA (guanine(527)-N(7))-methyltransferase RsmG [Clostridiales bacterium]|nr:16S rRNA (guanine(527)-N(7))-methyltransferase RsmG [Clostridiales bacterium]
MIDREYLRQIAGAEGFALTSRQLEQFDEYAGFLVEYNEKVNLTAITDPREICIKHFLDSLMLLRAVELPQGARLIDVGTGAGFPAVPVKIVREDVQVTLLDGLNKRITFLNQLSERLGQQNTALHARAEEAARGEAREQYDLATARAVADLRVLSEYCLPFVKVGGRFAALKGPDCREEVRSAKRAVELLGGRIAGVRQFTLPEGNARAVVVIEKIAPTPQKYPRHGGKIAKQPL